MIEIQILTTPGCTNCEAAKKVLESVVKEVCQEKEIRIEEIDLVDHPDIAVKHKIMSAPGIVINGKLEFLGVPKRHLLMDKIFLPKD